MPEKSWIQNALIYKVYPLTFNYASGSESDPYKGAYGNLKGITEKADYIKNLGVDALWISPFCEWNRNGFGYDVTNYEKVSPMFGTNQDLRELINTFHSKGIKVLTDQVFNHCSMEHEWFKKSIKKEEPYTDYFVWADAKGFDDIGKPIPPNNWPSTWDSSGSSAWAWNDERKQFYLHSFDHTMPNLNINNPVVQDKLLEISKYWFDLGIDGFRLDGTTHYGYDPRLLDNPIIGKETTPNLSDAEIEAEEGQQMRVYDINHELGRRFIDRIKTLAESYPKEKVLLSEYVFDKGVHGNRKGVKQIRESACDTFYIGSLRGTLKDFRPGVEEALKISENGAKINWAMSNHDMERVATRWFGKDYSQDKTKLAIKMLLSLPGSVCLFQGEELGLPNPDIERAKNPTNDPLRLSSIVGMPWDATRTSIPWSPKGTHLWLKPTPEQCILAQNLQEQRSDSMLHATRDAVSWRKQNNVLNHVGHLDFIETENPEVIAFIRSDEERKNKLALCFNYTPETVTVKIPLSEKTFKTVKIAPQSTFELDINKENIRSLQKAKFSEKYK